MRNSLKRIYYYVIEIFKTMTSLFSILLFSKLKYRSNRNDNRSCKGKSASLIANGPSVKHILNERRELLHNTDIMVLNDMANTEVFWSLKPQYYIIMDPAYFIDDFVVKSEENVESSEEMNKRFLNNLLKIDWPIELYLPAIHFSKFFFKKVSANKNINVILLNATRVEGFTSFQHFAYKRNLGIPSSRNVIIPALLVLINKKFDNIYMYGTEFSWTKTMDVDVDNGKLFFNDRHFYSNKEIRYFGKGGYIWWLAAILDMLIGVDRVADYAKSKGVRVVNRTKGSFIDSFEYENIDNIK